jgi:lipoprotein-anchoring transpeptidase ErfK/SrfK
MRRLLCAVAIAALPFVFLPLSARAEAAIVVHIDRARQIMAVVVDGVPRYFWRISTGRRGYGTPAGIFHPQRLALRWYSRKYYHSPMPYSIFFHGGIAIHGTYETAYLGRAVSHGCVRLSPAHAAMLFDLVEQEGSGSTTIVVH